MTSSGSSGVVEPAKSADFFIENNILKGALEPLDDDRKIGQVILNHLNKNLDHVSQIDAETGKQTTNGYMKDRSIRCALWLKKLRIGPDDIIVVVSHNHLDSCIPFVASFFADVIFSAWNHAIKIHTARRFMKQFAPKVIFACENAADMLAQAAKLENLSIELVVFGHHSNLLTFTDIMSYQTQEEIDNFTVENIKSTTGFPKGVMLNSKSLLYNMPEAKCYPAEASKVLWYSTIDWISCVLLICGTIVKHQTRIIPSSCEIENLFQVVQKYKVNKVVLPPNIMTYMAKSHLAQKYDLKSVNTITFGGAIVSKEVLNGIKRIIPNALFENVYGITEVGCFAISTPACKHINSAGFVRANYQVKFVDVSLGPNLHGEVYVKSPTTMVRYHNNPESTERAFDEEGWYRTGDIGYYDDRGEIFVIRRTTEIISYRNIRIPPAEIEEILLTHPDIQEAIVVGFPHEEDGEWPVALCKKAPESKITEAELMKLTSVLEDYKKLRGGIHFIDNFLHTSSGKIARNQMKKVAENLLKGKDLSQFLA